MLRLLGVLWNFWVGVCFVCFWGAMAWVVHAFGWAKAGEILLVLCVGVGICLVIYYAPVIVGLVVAGVWIAISETAKAAPRKIAQLVKRA